MWNVGGMIIPQENCSVLKKTYFKATCPTENTTWTLMSVEPDIGVEMSACPGLWHSYAIL
jgi:hypothetical protein